MNSPLLVMPCGLAGRHHRTNGDGTGGLARQAMSVPLKFLQLSAVSLPLSIVHAIRGIRQRPPLSAGGRIPTIACGMDRNWRQEVKKWLIDARGRFRSAALPLLPGTAPFAPEHIEALNAGMAGTNAEKGDG
jgi:hypothetical protein